MKPERMFVPVVSEAAAEDFRAFGVAVIVDKPIPLSATQPDDSDLEANNPPLDDIFTILDFIDQVNSSEDDPEDDDDEDPGWGEMSQWDLDGEEPDDEDDDEA